MKINMNSNAEIKVTETAFDEFDGHRSEMFKSTMHYLNAIEYVLWVLRRDRTGFPYFIYFSFDGL